MALSATDISFRGVRSFMGYCLLLLLQPRHDVIVAGELRMGSCLLGATLDETGG
jgi:hypothetical protein